MGPTDYWPEPTAQTSDPLPGTPMTAAPTSSPRETASIPIDAQPQQPQGKRLVEVFAEEKHDGTRSSTPRPGSDDDPLQALKTWRPDVYALMQEMARKQIQKGHDYSGADRDTFQNLRASEDMGIPAWKGVMIRMSDKWRRLSNFARQEQFKVADESFEDTCVDLANYSLFVVLMFREAQHATRTLEGPGTGPDPAG